MTIDQTKTLLGELNFPPRRITDQTALCIMALADTKPRQRLLVDTPA